MMDDKIKDNSINLMPSGKIKDICQSIVDLIGNDPNIHILDIHVNNTNNLLDGFKSSIATLNVQFEVRNKK